MNAQQRIRLLKDVSKMTLPNGGRFTKWHRDILKDHWVLIFQK